MLRACSTSEFSHSLDPDRLRAGQLPGAGCAEFALDELPVFFLRGRECWRPHKIEESAAFAAADGRVV